MPEKRVKTTKKQFDEFVAACKKWQKRFGVFDMKVFYYHEELEDGKYAEIQYCIEKAVASIRLNTSMSMSGVSGFNADQTARHEILHLVTSRYACIAQYRYVRSEEIEEVDEKLVRTMEYIIDEAMNGEFA